MIIEAPDAPIDPTSVAALASQGLRFAVVEGDAQAIEDFNFAVARGFLEGRGSADQKTTRYERFFERRNSAVYDDTSAEPQIPVGTVNSWITDLTTPGRNSVPAWAISAVTVAATHRRRGIASALLNAELRTADSLGVAVAMLTVSEATIYGRFGFAPAAMSSDWKIETQRASWIGPRPGGRVLYVPTEQFRDAEAKAVNERIRLETPGMIDYAGHLQFRQFGLPGKPDFETARTVRYDDEAGHAQGYAIYRIKEVNGKDIAELSYLAAATDDAYAALWRFLLELDLVQAVTAKLRTADEPVYWQIADKRAAHQEEVREHLWTRILDTKAALEARSYGTAGIFALEVSDELGFANGTWRLDAATGLVTAASDIPSEAHHLRMSVNELSAIYLGGVSVVTLVRAGSIVEVTPGAAVAAEAAFHSPVTPWTSIWF
jgi:predicted acetyltransferase